MFSPERKYEKVLSDNGNRTERKPKPKNLVVFDKDRKGKSKNAKIHTKFLDDGEPVTSVEY